MQFTPALLEHHSTSFQTQMQRLMTFFTHIHIDIGDGIYVPNTTLSLKESIYNLPPHEDPTSVTLDFHLMVNDYGSHITILMENKEYLAAKHYTIGTVFLHANIHPQLGLFQQSTYMHIGLVLNPTDTIHSITDHYDIHQIPTILIMTVTPGFQGSPFNSAALDKIKQLRDTGFKGDIYLDGGVNNRTLPLIAQLTHTPDYVCIGSYFTQAHDLQQNITVLNDIIQ